MSEEWDKKTQEEKVAAIAAEYHVTVDPKNCDWYYILASGRTKEQNEVAIGEKESRVVVLAISDKQSMLLIPTDSSMLSFA